MGGSVSVHAGIPPPSKEKPPGKETPLARQTPLARRQGDKETPPGKADPPGKETPCTVHALRYSQQAGGMHPTGMQSC